MIETATFCLKNGGVVIVEYDYEKCAECGQPKITIKLGAELSLENMNDDKPKDKYKLIASHTLKMK